MARPTPRRPKTAGSTIHQHRHRRISWNAARAPDRLTVIVDNRYLHSRIHATVTTTEKVKKPTPPNSDLVRGVYVLNSITRYSVKDSITVITADIHIIFIVTVGMLK
jgi:hypothetical protein